MTDPTPCNRCGLIHGSADTVIVCRTSHAAGVAAERKRWEDERHQLRQALTPFARVAQDKRVVQMDDIDTVEGPTSVGYFRSALAALGGIPEETP